MFVYVFIFVCFDFFFFFFFLAKNDRVCSIDIGDGADIKSTGQMVFMVAYQWYNIYAYLAPSIIGNAMGRISISSLFFVSPMARRDRVYSGFSSKMNYLYFYSWNNLLCGPLWNLFGFRKMVPFGRVPDVPLFFGFAGKGVFPWHKKWRQEVPKRNQEKGYQGCYIYKKYNHSAHWVHCENSQDVQELDEDLLQWLKHTDGKDIAYVSN